MHTILSLEPFAVACLPVFLFETKIRRRRSDIRSRSSSNNNKIAWIFFVRFYIHIHRLIDARRCYFASIDYCLLPNRFVSFFPSAICCVDCDRCKKCQCLTLNKSVDVLILNRDHKLPPLFASFFFASPEGDAHTFFILHSVRPFVNLFLSIFISTETKFFFEEITYQLSQFFCWKVAVTNYLPIEIVE